MGENAALYDIFHKSLQRYVWNLQNKDNFLDISSGFDCDAIFIQNRFSEDEESDSDERDSF